MSLRAAENAIRNQHTESPGQTHTAASDVCCLHLPPERL